MIGTETGGQIKGRLVKLVRRGRRKWRARVGKIISKGGEGHVGVNAKRGRKNAKKMKRGKWKQKKQQKHSIVQNMAPVDLSASLSAGNLGTDTTSGTETHADLAGRVKGKN